jgi:hypothetical protein
LYLLRPHLLSGRITHAGHVHNQRLHKKDKPLPCGIIKDIRLLRLKKREEANPLDDENILSR